MGEWTGKPWWHGLTPEQRSERARENSAKAALINRLAKAERPNPNKSLIGGRTKSGRRIEPCRVGEWDTQSELELLRDGCRRSFWTFFCYGYGCNENPKGRRWIDEAIHKPLADWFQHHVLDWIKQRESRQAERKHLAVLVHRGVGKTTMISQAGQSWLHVIDPEISSYTGSENTTLATKIMNSIQAVMDGSDPYALFPKLYGNWSASARKWTGRAVTHAARKNTSRTDPSLGTFAVETSIVGAHPDAIFYDDPISYERLSTDANWLTSVNSQVTSLIPVIQPDGLIVWVGTRYDDLDHFGVAFRDEGVASVSGMTESCPYKPDPEGKWHVYFLAGRDQQDRPTTPKIWSEKLLKSYEKTDNLRYASQVMNDPSISEANPLTPDQIRQCLIKPDQVPWSALRFAICCDFAFSDGTKIINKDETCYVIHGYPRNGSGDVYIVEAFGDQRWRAEDFAKHLISSVQRYRRQGRSVFAITGETARSGLKEVARTWLANRFADVNEPMPNYIEFERGGTKKYARLQNAATFWQDGHVRVVEGAPGVHRLMEQMGKIGQYAVNPRIKIDFADAHSDAFQPQLYQPMRRPMTRSPWHRGAESIEAEGLDPRRFDDDEWNDECPRPPLRRNA